MLQLGFVLADMIQFLMNPVGAVLAVSLLAYLEYVTVKSVIKDINMEPAIRVWRSAKVYIFGFINSAFFQLERISIKEISISEDVVIKIKSLKIKVEK